MSGLLEVFYGLAVNTKVKAQGVIDALFPPEKREDAAAWLQAFAISNPKLAAFFFANIAVTGVPLLMFLVFSLSVFVFSLIATLLIGVLVALLFTAFMMGLAFLVMIPTVFVTSFAACFLFVWGLVGYYILKWFNQGEIQRQGDSAIGDKLNNMTGGRLTFFLDGAVEKEKEDVDHKPKGPRKSNASDGDSVGSQETVAEMNEDGVKKPMVNGVHKWVHVNGATDETQIPGTMTNSVDNEVAS